jgi:uncharacterized membrane protein YphA (DoxX/SURF4 family)
VVGRDVPLLARLAAVGLTTYPALRKFAQYPERVAQFAAWGLPWPEVAVLVAGTVQVLALVTVGLGVGGRFGASALALVMVVAVSTAGPTPLNGTVFLSAVVVARLGTGRYSVWDPAVSNAVRTVRRTATGGV